MVFIEFKNLREHIISLNEPFVNWVNYVDCLSESDWSRCFWSNSLDIHEIFENDTIGEDVYEKIILEDILEFGSIEQIIYCLDNEVSFNSILQQRWNNHYASFDYFCEDAIRVTMVTIFLWIKRRYGICDSVINRYYSENKSLVHWNFTGILCNARDVADAEWAFGHLGKNIDVIFCDKTPLINSSANCDLNLTKLLLENGANPNFCDEDGYSPLLEAVSKRCDSVVELLMSAGADPLISNNRKQSPISRARKIGDQNIISIFNRFGYLV